MTKQELQTLLKDFGTKGNTDTRRTVRVFWVFVSAVAFAVGVFVGHLFW